MFDKSIFEEIRSAMDAKLKSAAFVLSPLAVHFSNYIIWWCMLDVISEDPTLPQSDQLRLEQDVISPLAASRKLYVYQAISPWVQIKSAACVVFIFPFPGHSI